MQVQGASPIPHPGAHGRFLGLDSGDLVPWEEPSESEDIISRKGDLLVGFFFFFLRFSCLDCFKFPVPSSITVQSGEGSLASISFLER